MSAGRNMAVGQILNEHIVWYCRIGYNFNLIHEHTFRIDIFVVGEKIYGENLDTILYMKFLLHITLSKNERVNISVCSC